MNLLEQKLEAQFTQQRNEIARLKREYGRHAISDVTVAQLYGGMRGITSVVCDTSEVHPQMGLIIRGRPVKELAGINASECFWLLLTGELPTEDEGKQFAEYVMEKTGQLGRRLIDAGQPGRGFQLGQHPVVRLCLLFQSLQHHSQLLNSYYSTPRDQHWRLVLDDALDIYVALSITVALLYNQQTGIDLFRFMADSEFGTDQLFQLTDLYILAHCDHEGSNACALACRTAASTLADPYLALTAGWRALAGPIHGLASQVCIEFIDELRAKLGDAPSDNALAAEVQARIAGGKVIPGFGHAVLRAMDPRYELLHAFGMQHFPDDPALRIADGLLRVVPPQLQATGKVANPWPNVDGISGAIMQHYGLTDYRWLTVLFAACMSLGLLAQMVISRGLGEPIVHPKAITPELLRRRVEG